MNKPFHHLLTIALVAATSIFMVNCKNETPPAEAAETPATAATAIAKNPFGTSADGQAVDKYSLKNKQGMQVDIITYGGIITSWTAPDKAGNYANVVLGYDNLAQYEKATPYFGALIGRYGNRIAKGKFTLDGQTRTPCTAA
jgi:aldose 1-epimerase